MRRPAPIPVLTRCYALPMEAQVWTVIGLLAATLIGSMFYLGTRIDGLSNDLGTQLDTLGTRIERLEARIDGRIGRPEDRIPHQDARIDSLSARIDSLSAIIQHLGT